MPDFVIELEDEGSPSAYTERSVFTQILGSPGRAKMIDVFLSKYDTELTASELAGLAGIATTTVNRNIDVFRETEMIEEREVSGTSLYRLNSDSQLARALGEARDEMLKQVESIYIEPIDRRELINQIIGNLIDRDLAPPPEDRDHLSNLITVANAIINTFQTEELEEFEDETQRQTEDDELEFPSLLASIIVEEFLKQHENIEEVVENIEAYDDDSLLMSDG